MNRQPEDYADGENIRKRDFMRAWNHSRNHPHFTIEQMEKDGIQIASGDAVECEVTGELDVEQFKSKLSETDKKILEMRVEGYGLEKSPRQPDTKQPALYISTFKKSQEPMRT